MTEKYEKLVELCRRSIEHDPWTKESGIRGYMNAVAEESTEVKNATDDDNLCEECGDVLLDVIHLCLLAEMEGKFTLQESIDGAINKLNRRKPYLKEKRTVTKEESSKLWQDAKKSEKL